MCSLTLQWFSKVCSKESIGGMQRGGGEKREEWWVVEVVTVYLLIGGASLGSTALLPRCSSTLCPPVLEPNLDLTLREREPFSQSGPLSCSQVLCGTEGLFQFINLIPWKCCSALFPIPWARQLLFCLFCRLDSFYSVGVVVWPSID